jgi:hypothetical protein
VARFLLALFAFSCIGLVGCESVDNGGMKKAFAPLLNRKPTAQQEEQHRMAFQESRDSKDLHWLLANRVESGMTVKQVGGVIGENGLRVHKDSWIKNRGGNYQSTDEVWKWRATRNGQAIYLVFRNGNLVNFDPAQFREEEWD